MEGSDFIIEVQLEKYALILTIQAVNEDLNVKLNVIKSLAPILASSPNSILVQILQASV